MNVSGLIPLIVHDGEVFLGLNGETKELYYQAADAKGLVLWQVLDCSECRDHLAAYLISQATLYQVYNHPKTKKRYDAEDEDNNGEFFQYPASSLLKTPPFEESVLYPPNTKAFATVFPRRVMERVPVFCKCYEVLDAAAKRRLQGDYQ